ncbi:MAG: enoyl-CoA hydratase/isomerase family protein [Pseudomonadota bacterium]
MASDASTTFDFEHMAVAFSGDVATITLNRPEQRNALSQKLRDELKEFLQVCAPLVKVVVLTGAGKAFCAGMDLKEKVGFREGENQWGLFRSLFNADTIFVAAVNGPARGAGLTLITACDIAVADPSSDFALPQITHGIYGGIATTMLQLSLPKKAVAELVLTGIPMSADRAVNIGLINHVSAPGESLAMAQRIANRIAGFDRKVLKIAKRMIGELPYDDGARESAVKATRLATLEAAPITEDRIIDTRFGPKDGKASSTQP